MTVPSPERGEKMMPRKIRSQTDSMSPSPVKLNGKMQTSFSLHHERYPRLPLGTNLAFTRTAACGSVPRRDVADRQPALTPR